VTAGRTTESSDSTIRPVGVLLAAGRARRMGRTKQLLPWPGASPASTQSTVVGASFDLIAPECRSMITVLGHDADDVARALEPRAFHSAHSDPDADLMASIRRGLECACTNEPGAPVMLHLADHPGVRRDTVRAILAASREHPNRAIIGTVHGKGGHPVFVPAAILPEILAWSGNGGLRRFWEDHPDQCARIELDDPALVRDLDHPADYQSAIRESAIRQDGNRRRSP